MVFGPVDQFDPVYFAFVDQLAVHVVHRDLPVGPAGVVPHDERSLLHGVFHRLYRIVRVERVGVGQEKGVHVAEGFLACDLGSGYHQDAHPFARFGGDLVGLVLVAADQPFLYPGTVFDMFGDRDGVESFVPRLVDSHVGPHAAVGIGRMDVEVAF